MDRMDRYMMGHIDPQIDDLDLNLNEMSGLSLMR